MDIIFQTLSSQSFIQSFLVLLATALLTGLLVPFVKANMDERKLRQQKLFEADLARQDKVIEAQVALLENLAQMLWDFKLLALEVSYYKLNYGRGQAQYEAALQKYDDAAWVFFSKIRAEISKARRLTSDEIYKQLLKFYEDDLMGGDRELMELVRTDAPEAKWLAQHNALFASAERTDEILNLLAEGLRLVSPPLQKKRVRTRGRQNIGVDVER